jgi:glycosyltransferase involved in cell wall biosynthesis
LITVSKALKTRLLELGIGAERIRVLRNGVDLQQFRAEGRLSDRQELGLTGKVLLMVGNLVELKGHCHALAALKTLTGYHLLIAGDGPLLGSLKSETKRLGIEGRVHFLGRVPHEDLPSIYRSADCLLLCSSREGWPNVLLESMACGTPVVAVDIPGIREVVASEAAGTLCPERSGSALAESIERQMSKPEDPKQTRKYAEGFSWEATTKGQLELFQSILGSKGEAS